MEWGLKRTIPLKHTHRPEGLAGREEPFLILIPQKSVDNPLADN